MTALDRALPDPALAALRAQLESAAASFVGDAAHLGALLRAMVDDVSRANAEAVEVFPVKHHSPSSALHMVRRLRTNPPKVIFMEGCEDLNAALDKLRNCKFPVALQAYAPEAPAFPVEWTPLNCVLPLTEFSAEYQVIAHCLQNPETKLVFVDRSVDHVFQWMPREGPPPGSDAAEADGGEPTEAEAEESETEGTIGDTSNLHGGAIGLQIGATQPTFSEFVDVLLRNAKVRHYGEWWTQYVEGPTLSADYTTYRQVFFLVGSLLRRIGITDRDRGADVERERYMWLRIREYLQKHKVDPKDTMYVCGAIHAVSPIPEFGHRGGSDWKIPPRTDSKWFYGIVPSSYTAIERQFDMPAGEISIAQSMWDKGLASLALTPYRIVAEKPEKPEKAAKAAAKPVVRKAAATPPPPPPPSAPAANDNLGLFLTRPPAFIAADDEQLMRWCIDVVQLARKNGYGASTADTIAILHTSNLLASIRDRPHPSPYDFQDAAITCLEKDRVPGRRNILRICQILLGGDRIGRVDYEGLRSWPRTSTTASPSCPTSTSRPAASSGPSSTSTSAPTCCPRRTCCGASSTSASTRSRSWASASSARSRSRSRGSCVSSNRQHSIIQLGYEGLTVESVLEKRLKAKAFEGKCRAAKALEAAEDSVLYLKSGRLTRELGLRATDLLRQETDADDAPDIFQRVRGLVHYFRTIGLPEWIKDFVATGYRHYATLLPYAFTDRGTTPRQLAAMLAFIFTQEALAFAMGCERSQLLIAVAQAEPEDPPKIALHWAAQWILGQRDEEAIREDFLHLLTSPLLLPAFPDYMAGFLLALEFTPRISRLAVEFLSRAFALLPDEVLVPWLPKLVVTLRPLGSGLMQTLIKEAGLAFPRDLGALPTWEFAWERKLQVAPPPAPTPVATQATTVATVTSAPAVERSPSEQATAGLLRAEPATLDVLAGRLGLPATWASETSAANQPATATAPTAAAPTAAAAAPSTPAAAAAPSPLGSLLAAHPEALEALAKRLQKAF